MRGQGINHRLPNNCEEMVSIKIRRVEVRMWYPEVAMFPTQIDAASTPEQCVINVRPQKECADDKQ
eukprot:8333551-Ditylum_brightwellii.AAC.1